MANNNTPLYTFSRYATAHIDGDSVYGITISGYLTDNETGKRKYVNLWIDTEDGKGAALAKAHDGSFVLKVRLTGVTERLKHKSSDIETPHIPSGNGLE